MSEATPSLSAALAQERSDSLLKQARIVRDWKDEPQRAEQAKSLIRQALVEWATGRISQEIEAKLYCVLSFAMPESNDTRVETYEAAHRQQMEQRSCPECGDGQCPVPNEK